MRSHPVGLTVLYRVLVCASLALVGTAGPALADGPDITPWVGAYKSASPAEAKSTIKEAIAHGTDSMGLLRKKVARKRLAGTNIPYNVVRISGAGDEVITDFDGHRYQAPSDGASEKGTDPQGKVVAVSYRAEGRTLRGRFVAEDGEKRIDFERSPDGRELTVHVTVLSKKLPEPIRYSMRYTKQ